MKLMCAGIGLLIGSVPVAQANSTDCMSFMCCKHHPGPAVCARTKMSTEHYSYMMFKNACEVGVANRANIRKCKKSYIYIYICL